MATDLSDYTFEYDEFDNDVTAKFDGKTVGRFELVSRDDDYGENIVAYHIEVDAAHRRKGIATELVRIAVDSCGPFELPSFIPHSSSRDLDSCDYYTHEGLRLFWSCKEKGIVPEGYFRENPAG